MATSADKPTVDTPIRQNADTDIISELERVNRAHRTLSAGNRTLLRASDEQQLLHEMCRVIVDAGGYRIAAVGYAEHDQSKSIRWKAAVGMETEQAESFHFTWDDTELGDSVPGTAIRSGQPVVNKHINAKEYSGEVFAPIRE